MCYNIKKILIPTSCVLPSLFMMVYLPLNVPVLFVCDAFLCCSCPHGWRQLWRSSLWIPVQVQRNLVSRVPPRPRNPRNNLVRYNIRFWPGPKKGKLLITWQVIIQNVNVVRCWKYDIYRLFIIASHAAFWKTKLWTFWLCRKGLQDSVCWARRELLLPVCFQRHRDLARSFGRMSQPGSWSSESERPWRPPLQNLWDLFTRLWLVLVQVYCWSQKAIFTPVSVGFVHQSAINAAKFLTRLPLSFCRGCDTVSQFNSKSNLKEVVKIRHRNLHVFSYRVGKCHITVNSVGIQKKEWQMQCYKYL